MIRFLLLQKDDRYQYLENRNNDEEEDHNDELEDDDYDANDYLLSIRDVVASFPGVEQSMMSDDAVQIRIPFAGDDSLPPLNSINMKGLRKLSSRLTNDRYHQSENSRHSETDIPTGFAKVGKVGGEIVVIKWLNPNCKNKIVNLSAVMNRGAFCVPHYFPLSKAYMLFTKLGLRWIVVTGSSSGGKVVGILTRKNLLPAEIQAKTK